MSYEPQAELAELLRNWGRWCQGGGPFGAASVTGLICDRMARHAGVWGDEPYSEPVDEAAARRVHAVWMKLDRFDKDTLTHCYAKANRSALGIAKSLGISRNRLDARIRRACDAMAAGLGMVERFHATANAV